MTTSDPSPSRVPPSKKGKPWRSPGQATLSVAEAAELLELKPDTLRRLADEGVIPSFRIGRRGFRRFYRDAVEAFARANGLRLNGSTHDHDPETET